MASLDDEQKTQIVMMLACFRSPATIIGNFRREYGLELSHKQVGAYDPGKSYYEGGERWRAMFEQRRKVYLEDISAIPIAHQGYRLNLLDDMVHRALADDRLALAAHLLKQAAEEVGGGRTNERAVPSNDYGRPKAADMTPEERRAAITEIIRKAMEERERSLQRAAITSAGPRLGQD